MSTPDEHRWAPADPPAPAGPAFAPVTGGFDPPGVPLPNPATAPAADMAVARSRRSKASIWVVVLLAVVVALTALVAYLWVINSQWQAQNEQLRAHVADLSEQVYDSAAHIAALEAEVAQAEANLEGATGKVTDLADASANAQDQAAYLNELTESFSQCVQAQRNHISHLQDASRYTASSLAAEGREVAQYCADVQRSYEEFLAANASS